MIAMFGVAGASAVLTGAHPTEAQPVVPAPMRAAAVPPPATTAGTPRVTATELWAAYSLDALSADRSYRDRSLVVTGTVRSVDRNYEGDMVVRLGTGDAFDTVNATLAARNDSALASVAKGSTVSLICVGHGALMGAPQLAGCFVK
ncbi:MAG TPA: hypothetical protein VKZ18_19075 [Polyangia bacterium]|nr:hypothetical protein [Polyangia bacterium]